MPHWFTVRPGNRDSYCCFFSRCILMVYPKSGCWMASFSSLGGEMHYKKIDTEVPRYARKQAYEWAISLWTSSQNEK